MNGWTARALSGRVAATALAGCLALVLGGCGSRMRATDVMVTPAQVGTLTVTPGGPAATVAAHETSITAARRGTVVSLSVTAGQRVDAGQPVAVVRETGTSTEQHALALELEAQQTLLTAQRSSTGRYSPVVNDTLTRIADLRRQLAGVLGAPTVLTASNAGVVAALTVGAGSEVDTAKPLMRIVDVSSVQITVALAGEYQTVVHVGDHGNLVVAGGREVPATVTGLVPLAHADSGFQVTVLAANTDAALPIGTTAYLRLPESIPDALRVPTRSILGTSGKPYVYVVDHGLASLVPVTVGPSDGTWTQVLSGLHSGQRVVLTGNQNLVDREAVHVSGEQAPT